MTEKSSDDELRRVAADPSTSQEVLASLAHEHPELRVLIAGNPSAYDGLLEWLAEHGDADVAAAVARRTAGAGPAGAQSTGAGPAGAEPSGAGAEPTASIPRPALSRRAKTAVIVGAAVVVVAALVAGGAYALPNLLRGGGPTADAAANTKASDYRYGATKTWQTKLRVATPGDEVLQFAATVQSYPGLWLVYWPEEGAGSGSIAGHEPLLGVDPTTGLLKWSTTQGLWSCASSLVGGGLACADTQRGELSILDPSTGKATSSPLNGRSARDVQSYRGDLVLSDEQSSSSDEGAAVDTIERVTPGGSVVWSKSGTCSGATDLYGVGILTYDALDSVARATAKMTRNDAYLDGACLNGVIDLDSGVIDTSASIGGDDGCSEVAPYPDMDGLYSQGDPCTTRSPLIVSRGSSTLAAITGQTYRDELGLTPPPTLWSTALSDAEFSPEATPGLGFAHLGGYAVAASGGHLYGLNTSTGPVWEQAGAFGGDKHVQLLPVDASKPNTPVLALDGDSNILTRFDAGYGSPRVSIEPASLPSCPTGLTPVAFSTWSSGKGATLVCQGFTNVVTVYLIVDGTTYSSVSGRITPTGYSADLSGGVSVDIGLGGWTTWVTQGGATTLHAATSAWHGGDARATKTPPLTGKIASCPTGTYPLSLSTWHGGWLLTCGTASQKVTRFLFVEGPTHGSGAAMTGQDGQSCGTGPSHERVCVSASPAVVTFQPQGGAEKQHSVDASYVAGHGFGGAGQGTGAYGLADPKKDAASQVAYLNGILQASQAARTSVKAVLQSISRCTASQDTVQAAQSVVDARNTELQALGAAPVDALPGGSDMVAQLRAALQGSLTADQAYVTAATQAAGGDCAAGRATYNAQASLLTQITAEKTAFSNAWNSQIASTYGTPTYSQDGL